MAIGFLAGSLPFGVMIARSRGIDIRSEGSGNPGATNVGRVLGKPFGIACFFLDATKGAVPVLLAGWLAGRPAGRLAFALVCRYFPRFCHCFLLFFAIFHYFSLFGLK